MTIHPYLSLASARAAHVAIQRAQDQWDSAPDALRDAFVSLHPPIYTERHTNAPWMAYYEIPGYTQEALSIRALTDAELAWLRLVLLRDARAALETLELTRALYERVPGGSSSVKAPFRGILINPCFGWIYRGMRLAPDSSCGLGAFTTYDTTSKSDVLMELRALLRDSYRDGTVDLYTPQQDLFKRSAFGGSYLGVSVYALTYGVAILNVMIPNERYKALSELSESL